MSYILLGLWALALGKVYPPANPTATFVGKMILLTGANVGLGFEAATKFVSLGAKSLIMGVRNFEKGNNAKDALEAKTHTRDIIKVNREVDKLDIAELNAGVLNRSYKGFRGMGGDLASQCAVDNTAGLTLVAEVESVKDRDKVNPAAVLVEGGVLKHLSSEIGFPGQRQYGISKLFIEYVTREIAALTREPNGQLQVIVNSLCLGLCKSSLARSYDRLIEHIGMFVFYGMFGRSTEQGSRTLVSAVTQGEESHGRWWRDDGYLENGPLVTSEEGQKLHKKVWNEILDALQNASPEGDKIARGNIRAKL